MIYQPSLTNVYLLKAIMMLQCDLAVNHNRWMGLLSAAELVEQELGIKIR